MTTTLKCLPWMQSQHDQNPCTVAQEIGELCNAEYTVSLTNFQENNYVPNTSTANGCTCSWSIYNLLSACSYCVGQHNYPSWTAWIASCGSNASNTSYLPSGLYIPQGIPYWATKNPYTWNSEVFNITEASNIAAVHADVTGAALPTSTTTSRSISTGAIVGGVIGAIVTIIFGGLIVCRVVRRRRRQRGLMTPTTVATLDASRPATVPIPPIRNQSAVRPSQYGYTYHPVHSTPSLPTSSLASPSSSGFSSHGRTTSPPFLDGTEMITPFLSMSPSHRRNPSSTSLPMGKAAEAIRERAPSPAGQRTRLNPPPYSPFAALESPGPVMTTERRVSTKKHKKRNGSGSGATTHSGHTPTMENASSVHADPQSNQRRPGTSSDGTVVRDGNTASAGGADRVDGRGRTDVTRGTNAKTPSTRGLTSRVERCR